MIVLAACVFLLGKSDHMELTRLATCQASSSEALLPCPNGHGSFPAACAVSIKDSRTAVGLVFGAFYAGSHGLLAELGRLTAVLRPRVLGVGEAPLCAERVLLELTGFPLAAMMSFVVPGLLYLLSDAGYKEQMWWTADVGFFKGWGKPAIAALFFGY